MTSGPETRDPYEVLGLAPGATRAQIKTAFRRLSQKLHPDKNSAPDAGERFREVRDAYRVRNTLELGPTSQRVRLDPLAAQTVLARLNAPAPPAGDNPR